MSRFSDHARKIPSAGAMTLGLLAWGCLLFAGEVSAAAGSSPRLATGHGARTGAPQIQTSLPAGTPRFFNFASPPGTGDAAGEPSIGINWKSERIFSNSNGAIPNGGTVNYFGGFLPYMIKVTFDDCQSPAKATWEQKTLLTANTTRVYGDPILFTDKATGRTFVTQEEGLTPAGSTTDITDNDGDIFLPSQGSGAPSCVDHETVGGGPFHAPLTGTSLYPNAVYYASQCIGDAVIALSLDGGFTFNPSVPIFTVVDCDGLHGHIKVGPDGTVYVPDKGCGGSVPLLLGGGMAAAVVSEDNGTTWNIRQVPGQATREDDDPSIGVATDGTVYLGWQSLDGHPRIAVSHDKGLTWINVSDVGASAGVVNCAFPEVVAGDGGSSTGRAAFSFYGTTTPGDDYNQPTFTGDWYLYVATTMDGGATWTTQNITPGDPVQRHSGMCGSGTCRNQLDFYDMSIDKEGRILIGWDDGCINACSSGGPNSFTAKAVISRQTGGKRMFAAFDPVEPRIPDAPGISGNEAGPTVTLSWQAPDDGGDPITAYRIYRSIGPAGPYTLIATTAGSDYLDTVNPANQYFYHLTAVNSQGEGPFCHDYTPPTAPVPTPCLLPGLLTVDDLNANGSDNDAAQNTPPDPSVNVKGLYLAEPYVGPGVNQLTFTLRVAPSTTPVPPSSQWYIIWNRQTIAADMSDRRFVAMKTDATGALSFVYGDFGPPLPIGNVPPPNANTPTPLGAADSGSYDPATGLIKIYLSTSKADQTPIGPGSVLAAMNVRTYIARPDAGQKSQNNAADITNNGDYFMVGNGSCFCTVDQPPVASLTAAPSGGYPNLIKFDGSGSTDPDAGDGVASYTFTFGDSNAPLTQSDPVAYHIYKHPSGSSGYFATMTVTDQKCGHPSLNVASVNLNISTVTGVAPPHRPSTFSVAPLNNPSRGEVRFSLGLDRQERVHVGVFSSDGRRVAELADEYMLPGVHSLSWPGTLPGGRTAPAGVYLVQARAGSRTAVSRVMLIR